MIPTTKLKGARTRDIRLQTLISIILTTNDDDSYSTAVERMDLSTLPFDTWFSISLWVSIKDLCNLRAVRTSDSFTFSTEAAIDATHVCDLG